MQRDPLGGSPAAPLSLNRYAYADNDPTSATDPSGLLTCFIGGIGGPGNPLYAQFTTALTNYPTNLSNVVNFPAFGPSFGSNLESEIDRALFAALNPANDPDALALASQVKRDRRQVFSLEQLNLIGYSGGATVAFDVAVILGQHGISVDNIVTLGGVVLRGEPGNVGRFVDIVGDADPISTILATPDVLIREAGGRTSPTSRCRSYRVTSRVVA